MLPEKHCVFQRNYCCQIYKQIKVYLLMDDSFYLHAAILSNVPVAYGFLDEYSDGRRKDEHSQTVYFYQGSHKRILVQNELLYVFHHGRHLLHNGYHNRHLGLILLYRSKRLQD